MSTESHPENVGLFAQNALRTLPEGWRFHYTEKKRWQNLRAEELASLLDKTIAALVAFGIKKGDRVASFGPNRPEMFILDLAAMSIGALSTVFPDTAQFTQMPSFLSNAQPTILFVNGQSHVDRLPSGRPSHIVVFADEAGDYPYSSRFQLEGFKDFLTRSRDIGLSVVRDRLSAVKGEDPAFIIYTSGTEGEPKAIVHSHRAFMGLAAQMRDEYGLEPGEVVLAFVPLCHMPARLGFLLAISEPYSAWMNPDLTSLPQAIMQVKPTFLPGVPRMFERIRGVVLDKSLKSPGSIQALLHWALKQGLNHHLEGHRDLASLIGYNMADKLVLSKIRSALGGKVKKALCGGARVDPAILRFFASLGIRVRETYGMTEVGVIAIQPPDVSDFGTVGRLAADVEVELRQGDEIWIRSPLQLLGYWHGDRGLRPATDPDGFFRTGDLGRFTDSGDLELIGRKKDMMKTSGGKKIAPGPLEAALTRSQYIERAVIIADGRPYPVALIAPEVDSIQVWAEKHDIQLPPQATWHRGGAPFDLIQREIQEALKNQPKYLQIKKFYIFPEALTAATGDITTGGKTRRAVIAVRHKTAIERLYQNLQTALNPELDPLASAKIRLPHR